MKRAFGISMIVLSAVVAIIMGCTSERNGTTPRNTLATPEETVKAYCDLDAAGVRLTSTTWSRVLPYISWSEEAGFDRAIVISGYTIGKVRKNGGKSATVPVTYQVLGVISGDYSEARKVETVNFKVSLTGRGWKINEPDFMPPHVLPKPMAEHLAGTKRMEAAEKVRNTEAK